MANQFQAAEPAAARYDLAVYNEATGFLITSAGQRGRQINPGEEDWTQAVLAGDLIPIELVQDDPFVVRVLVGGALKPQEAEEWVGRMTARLRVPDGRLAVAGGIEFVMEPREAEWVSEYVRSIEIPAGDYRAVIYAYLHGVNGEHLLDLVKSGKKAEPAGAYFRRTRPGQPFPPWLHNWCVAYPDKDPGHQKDWAGATMVDPAPEHVDFLLHLTPLDDAGEPPVQAPKLDQGFFSWDAFQPRKPGLCPLGLEARYLVPKVEPPQPPPPPLQTIDVMSRVADFAPEPLAGGPVEVPVDKMNRVYRLAWFATDSSDPEVRISLPPGANFAVEGEPIEGIAVEQTAGGLRIGFAASGAKWATLEVFAALAPRLASLPEGSGVELLTALEENQGERPPGLHRYRGRVEKGAWRIAETFPPMPAERLRQALALSAEIENGQQLAVAGDEEADTLLARFQKEWDFLLEGNPLRKHDGTLRFEKPDRRNVHLLAVEAFRLRFADTWPLEAEDEEDPFAMLQETIQRALTPGPAGELLLEGKKGRKYQAADMRAVGPKAAARMEETDREMEALGYEVLGDMMCTALSDLVVRGYARPEGDTWGVLIQGKFGQDSFDFSTRFEKGASLTTTLTPGSKDDKKKKAFKTSHPKAGITELHAHHLKRKAELAKKYGAPIRVAPELRALAERLEAHLEAEMG